jgi:hypothetical protein
VPEVSIGCPYALRIDRDWLYYLAGRFPEDVRDKKLSEKQVAEAMVALRGGPPLRPSTAGSNNKTTGLIKASAATASKTGESGLSGALEMARPSRRDYCRGTVRTARLFP